MANPSIRRGGSSGARSSRFSATAGSRTGPRRFPKFRTLDRFDPQWRLYARSAADNKAPIVALATALDALKASGIALTSNVRVLIDGELESGSPSLDEVLKAHRARLGADLLVLLDDPVHPGGRPTVVFGARGALGLELTTYGPKVAVHSGHYGNWVPNPGHSSRAAAGLDEGRRRAGAGQGLLRRDRAAARRRRRFAAVGARRRAKPDEAVRDGRARAQGTVAAAGFAVAVVEHPRAHQRLHGAGCQDDHSRHGHRGPRHPPGEGDAGARR